MKTWHELKCDAAEWFVDTFGEIYLVPMLEKLRGEALEAQAASHAALLEELADCRICLMGAEATSGYTEAELCAAVEFKLAKNRRRKWRKLDNGTWQHVKED